MVLRRLAFLLIILSLGGRAFAQSSASGNISAASTTANANNCFVASSCVWQTQLSPNAGTTTINIAGTFSATLLVEQSNNAGQTWTTAATLSSTGTTTYSANGFTDIRVRCSAYTSGTASVSISTGLGATTTAAAITSAVQGLSGCNTSGNVYVPAGSNCVTPSGGTGTVTSVSGTANQLSVTNPTTTPVVSITSPLITPGNVDLVSNSLAQEATTAAGSYTAGLIACVTATNTVGTCGSVSATLSNIGILLAKNGAAPVWASTGTATVLSFASASFTAGDIVCADQTNAAYSVDNGTVACGTAAQIGTVKATDSSVTSHTVILGQTTGGSTGGIGATPAIVSSGTPPIYGLVSSTSPTYDLVANGGCDPTGVAAADTCFANAVTYFNGKNGGTITGCGTFNLTAPPVIVNNPVAIVSTCGQAGDVDYGANARGGFVLTSTANVNVTNPTTAPTLTTSTSGGSLAATTQFWVQYTCVNGFGETLPSTGATITTGAGATNSITISNTPYVSGCFAYNVYIGTGASQPANGAMWKELNADFANGGGVYAGPPFLNTTNGGSHPQIKTNETSGTNPPVSNTAAHGGVLMQLGTVSSNQNFAYTIRDIYFLDSAHTLGAGLVNAYSTHTMIWHPGFDGFSVGGGSLAGQAAYENSGIGLVDIGGTVNYTAIYEPVFSGNILGMLAAGADTQMYGGNMTIPPSGLGMDYPSGSMRVFGTHFNPSGGSQDKLGVIRARGSNNGTHAGGEFHIKSEFGSLYLGPVMKFEFMTGVIFDCWCHTNGAGSAANAAATFDANSAGNIIRIAQSNAGQKIPLFSNGTTIGVDPSHGNQITGSVDGTFGTVYNTNGVVQTAGNVALSAGWQSTGSATVTALTGSNNTEQFTITTGTTTAANPTVTVTLPQPFISNTPPVCTLDQHGGTAATALSFQNTTQSSTAPVFTAIGTPSNSGATYIVVMRCGP